MNASNSRPVLQRVRAVTWNYDEAPRLPGEPYVQKQANGMVFHLDCGHELLITGRTGGPWTAEREVKKMECRFNCRAENNPNKEMEDAG